MTDRPPRLTIAQRQAAWRKRREERLTTLTDEMRRIRDEAKTIAEARKIATEALDN